MSPLQLGRGSQGFLIGGSPFLVRCLDAMDAEKEIQRNLNDYDWISRWVAVHHSSMSDSDLTDWQDKTSADAIRDREAAASIVCCDTSMGERVWGQTAEQSHSLLSLIVSSALGATTRLTMAPTRPIDSITDSMLFAESFVRRQQSLGIDGRTESISAVLDRSERTWRRQLV